MKRFLAFAWESYDFCGHGWLDLHGDFDTLEDAIASLTADGYGAGADGLRSHVADTGTGQQVWDNYVPKKAMTA